MDTDADDRDPMEKIDVRVPAAVLEAIDEEYPQRGYTSRSEAIRDALRDWLNPSPELSDEILTDLQRSRQQRERGETVPDTEIREQLNLRDSGSQPGEGREKAEYEFTASNDELLDRLQDIKDESNE